jgi:hypothetical protein
MTDDLARLRAALAARMRQVGVEPDDPRAAPLMARMEAALQQSVGAFNLAALAAPARTARDDADGSGAAAALAALPAQLRELVDGYMQAVRAACRPAFGGVRLGFFLKQAPALADTDAGRALLQLPLADKAVVVAATYAAWASQRFDSADRGLLRRVVSDLLRAKIEFSDAQAIALVKAAVREGFGSSSYSPNLAVAGALKRHVEARGLSPVLREALTGLRARMVHSAASQNSEGRKLLVIVDAMLSHAGDTAAGEPRFTAKDDAWGRALAAKLAGLTPELRGRAMRLLVLAAQGGGNAKPAKGWLKAAEQELTAGEREREGALLLEIIECHEPGAALAPENQNTLRALIWLAAKAAPADAARRLEAYAQQCLTFSSAHFAYLSLVLGNAAVHAFSLMPGTTGVGSLSRLKRRLKRPGEIKAVEKALAALAAARGMAASHAA